MYRTDIHKDYLLKDLKELEDKISDHFEKEENFIYYGRTKRCTEIFAIIKRIKRYVKEG